MVRSGTAKTQLNRRKPPRLPTMVGIAVATMLLSTAGMKVAISAATNTTVRCGTMTAGGKCCAAVWSTRPSQSRRETAQFPGGFLSRFAQVRIGRAHQRRAAGLANRAAGSGNSARSNPFHIPAEHGGAMAELDFRKASIDEIGAAFRRDGCVLLRNFIALDDLDALRRALDGVMPEGTIHFSDREMTARGLPHFFE